MQENTEREFVVDLLTTLRADRFRPRAWGSFFLRSWLMSRQTARANPSLQRSWQRVTGMITLVAVLILAGNTLFAGPIDTLRLLPGFLFCVVWQQSDLYWHLGLNRSVPGHTLLPTLGIANILTWLRGLGASYLLGRLSGGVTVWPGVALAVLLCGIVTDVLDGQIARRTATQTKLGQIADAEADFCLSLALTIVLLQNGALPLWVGLIILFRFLVPLVAALLSYLAFASPVRFGSTVWGKYAGLAQYTYFLLLLMPTPLPPYVLLLKTPLLVILVCLLILAPAAQAAVHARVRVGSAKT